MKYIDPKSLTIGVLAASLVFACTDSNNKTTNSPSLVSEAKAATGVGDKWDDKQEWEVADYAALVKMGLIEETGRRNTIPVSYDSLKVKGGWEPYDRHLFRKRIK